MKVLQELRQVKFVPKSILDFGSGTCSVFWAANELWGDKVEEYNCIDPCDEMNKFSMDVMRVDYFLLWRCSRFFGFKALTGARLFVFQGSDNNGNRVFIHPNVNFRRYLRPSPSQKYDLVVAHRVFVELLSHDSRTEFLTALWERTNR